MKLEDFFTKTNHETPCKLTLQMNGEDTEHYLMVLGSEARSVARAKIDWGLSIAAANKMIENFDGADSDRAAAKIEAEQACYSAFAAELVTGWSFGDFCKDNLIKLLDENPAIAGAVVAKAYDHTIETKKK